jgi:hypothetical protein
VCEACPQGSSRSAKAAPDDLTEGAADVNDDFVSYLGILRSRKDSRREGRKLANSWGGVGLQLFADGAEHPSVSFTGGVLLIVQLAERSLPP